MVILLLAVAVIALSVLLSPSTTRLSLFGWEVPPLCVWRRLTGHDCPGCGLTRSFTFVGHGDLASAFAMHKLGLVLWLATLAQIPWRIVLLWRARS